MKQALLIMLLAYPFILGQDLAKNNGNKSDEKKAVTSAALSPEEIKEGKDIIADAQKLAASREAAVKVFTEKVKNTPEARLLAYDSWFDAAQSLDALQVKLNKLVARAQDRTGCTDCGVDLEKGTLGKAPTPAK